MIMHVDMDRPGSVRSVEVAMMQDEKILFVAQKDPSVEEPTTEDVFRIGTIAKIKQIIKLPKNQLRVLAEGLERAEIVNFELHDGMYEADAVAVEEIGESDLDDTHRQAMLNYLKDLVNIYAHREQHVSHDLLLQIMDITDLRKLIRVIANNFSTDWRKRQKILDAVTLKEQYDTVSVMLANEIEALTIREELQKEIRQRIDKNQKEYILREQMKVIREELGEDGEKSDIDKFREQTEKLRAPKEVKDKLREEIHRFENAAGNPSESGVIRGYIETLLALPWNKASRDNRDLRKARQVLEADHYGLEKVKERIMEYLAVRIATKKGDAPILCLVGPPGTGKTSISKSVARALSKTYVRISLGGVRDEAEIRGHRRTYIGAMPGRIANGLIHAGVRNPLMLLDEIDKTSADYRGDVASSLLEVLDPEENDKFSDHYVEIPIDLSDVLFIATANDIQTIPKPLLDRMEIIEINSYTENEKIHIAKEHLIPKQIRANGLRDGQLSISDGAVGRIIDSYTREAGVRSLEREIGHICRKAVLRIQEKGVRRVRVTENNLEKFLGKARFHTEMANREPEIGIVCGLAWTSVGGTTLQIEVNIMPGKGTLMLTGQMGDVMKESAEIGISYIRSIASTFGVPDDFFEKNDIHIHIPEGAVPKDGPSAGITMATAMFSAVTGKPVRGDLAMTGEITLRGNVLPIGGLKEKLLAAKKAGIRTVLVPEENRPDVEEMESEITSGIEILYVKTMSQVLQHALIEKESDGGTDGEKNA